MMPAPGLVISATLIFSVYACCWARAEDARYVRGPESSIYSYSDDDMPERFFFTKEKARWDGSKVTMKEWYTLTDLQKEKFISEYMDELKKRYGAGIEAAGLDYLKALNLFSYYGDAVKTRESSTRFIDRLLSAQGKLSAPAVPAGKDDR